MRQKLASGVISALVVAGLAAPAWAQAPDALTPAQAEVAGIDLPFPPGVTAATPGPRSYDGAAQLNLLLIPDSTADRVMAFDPATGALIDADFIPADPDHLSTPICAILNYDGTQILVADQIDDVVQAYDLTGTYVGVFAPAGGPNTAILDNIRGISLRPNGNLLVSVGSGANAGAIAEFDTSGTYLGNFIEPGVGGITSPFDVFYRLDAVMVAEITNDQCLEYDAAGTFVGVLTPVDNFPEQITRAGDGNYLVGNFGGTQEGILDVQPDGTVVGIYDAVAEGGYRGVWELANGNLLVTTGVGVYEITRAVPSVLVDTKITGVSARFIEYTEEQVPVELLSIDVD
jgi:hypothetical protein